MRGRPGFEATAHLQWCSSEEQSVGGVVVLVEHLCQLAVVVLHPVALVNNHVLPTNLDNRQSV